MAEKTGIIGSIIRFVIGVIFAALAIQSLVRAVRRAYRAVRGIGGK